MLSQQFREFLNSLNFTTCLVLGLTILIYIFSWIWPTSLITFCFLPSKICHFEVYRLFTSPFFHASFFHIFFNLLTFAQLGNSLEKRIGSIQFLFLLFSFSILTSLVHLIIALIPYFLGSGSLYYNCSIGLSGIIFGMIVIDTQLSSSEKRNVFIFSVPSALYPWCLLILIQLLLPGVSFVGHLSGIIVGYLLCFGLLKWVFLPTSLINWLEQSKLLQVIVKLPNFVLNPTNLLPTFEGQLNSTSPQLNVIQSIKNYFSHLRQSWRSPNSIHHSTSQNSDSSSAPPSPSSWSSKFTSFSSPSKFPGQGMTLGTDPNMQNSSILVKERKQQEHLTHEMIEMGFTETQAKNALKKGNGQLVAAIDILSNEQE